MNSDIPASIIDVGSVCEPQQMVGDLPGDPRARICRLLYVWNRQVSHQIYADRQGYPQEYSYCGDGWDGPLPGAPGAKTYQYNHRMICGEGASAIEAIDDWYSKMPIGNWFAVIWRVRPEIASEINFETKKTEWRIFSRFALIPIEIGA